MTAFKLDFPYNLLISAKLGDLTYNEKSVLTQKIVIKESLLFKLIKKVGSLWQAG